MKFKVLMAMVFTGIIVTSSSYAETSEPALQIADEMNSMDSMQTPMDNHSSSSNSNQNIGATESNPLNNNSTNNNSDDMNADTATGDDDY